MAKTSALTLKDVDSIGAVDELPSMLPLLAEVERLAAEHDALERETQALVSNRVGFSPYKLGQLEEKRAPAAAALAQARLRVDEERRRLQQEVHELYRPVLREAMARLAKGLEKVAPVDAEVHALETQYIRLVPWAGRARVRRTEDDLRQLSRHMSQQIH